MRIGVVCAWPTRISFGTSGFGTSFGKLEPTHLAECYLRLVKIRGSVHYLIPLYGRLLCDGDFMQTVYKTQVMRPYLESPHNFFGT
jgi:hypothetical protein